VRTRVLSDPLSFYRRTKSLFDRANDGVATDTHLYPHKQIGNFRRLVLSLLLIDSYPGWLVPAGIATLRVVRHERIEHLLSSGPPSTSHLVCMVLSRVTKIPWTMHLRDPWTQGPQSKPTSKIARKLEASLERLAIKQATFVVCVTEQHT